MNKELRRAESIEVRSLRNPTRIRTIKNLLDRDEDHTFKDRISCYLSQVDPEALSGPPNNRGEDLDELSSGFADTMKNTKFDVSEKD